MFKPMFTPRTIIAVGWLFCLLLSPLFGSLPEQIRKRSFGGVGTVFRIGQCARHYYRVL